MLLGRRCDFMFSRLGQFYAFLLLLACLVVNIAFFAEVRELFLGDDDPLASIKSAFSELGIETKIADIFPMIQSQVDDVSESEPPAQKEGRSVSREPRQQSTSIIAEPVADPFPSLVPAPPAKSEKDTPKKSEEPKPVAAVPQEKSEQNRQIAITPAPVAVAATVQPVIANQFKPIIVEPTPTIPVKPSVSQGQRYR